MYLDAFSSRGSPWPGRRISISNLEIFAMDESNSFSLPPGRSVRPIPPPAKIVSPEKIEFYFSCRRGICNLLLPGVWIISRFVFSILSLSFRIMFYFDFFLAAFQTMMSRCNRDLLMRYMVRRSRGLRVLLCSFFLEDSSSRCGRSGSGCLL